MVNRACELAKFGERVLILQPTKELIEKTVRDELLRRATPPRYHVFHGYIVEGAVSGASEEHKCKSRFTLSVKSDFKLIRSPSYSADDPNHFTYQTWSNITIAPYGRFRRERHSI
jgi:hypothetical protein